MGFLAISEIIPPASVLPFAASSAPTGWLLCDGSAVSRTTYAALFATIGTSYGSGDGSTTFNLPDYRWTFLRGIGPNLTATSGSGTISSSNLPITAHGFNRSGIKIRVTSATTLPTNLTTNTDYWVIVIDTNTIAFASSKDNATAAVPTKVAISGSFAAVAISQWEDPDVGSRLRSAKGGNSGANIGSQQDDSLQAHRHRVTATSMGGNSAWGGGAYWASADGGSGPGFKDTDDQDGAVSDTMKGPTRLSAETRVKNIYINYIIKF